MVARAEAAAATQERMLASAWRRFSERAYEQVRLADIAADAGVTVQTLHSQFGKKDELFVAAWVWAIGPEGARRDSAPVGDVREAVRLSTTPTSVRAMRSYVCWPRRTGFPRFTRWPNAGRAWHRAWVERTFAPLLAGLKGAARERRLVALVVATDLLVWKLLRREMGLGRATAERIVIEMITATKGAS